MSDERSDHAPAGPDAAAPSELGFEPDDEFYDFAEPEVEESVTTALVEVRRSPKYWNFMILFAVLCAIAITIITFSLPYDSATASYNRSTIYGFALLISVAVGLALGAVVALIAERASRRSIRLVQAEQITGRVKDDGRS